MIFKLHDTIKIKRDRKDANVKKGDIGTIIDIHDQGEAFSIEFFDADNETIMESMLKIFYPEEIERI